jgi:hypothetical protein
MATNPHIYVSSVVGTNTGASDTSKATQQTGNITSMTAGDVYASIRAAVAGCSPSDGDTVYVCDNHSHTDTTSADIELSASTDQAGAGVRYISVDNTSIADYKQGAAEYLSANYEYILRGCGLLAGISLKSDDNCLASSPTSGEWRVQDCTLGANTSTDLVFYAAHDGVHLTLINVEIDAFGGNVTEAFRLANAARLNWYGGGTSASTNNFLSLIDVNGNGGCSANIVGVNLTKTTSSILSASTDSSDHIDITLQNCILDPSVSIHDGIASDKQRISLFNCDQTSTDAYHRFHVETGSGTAINNDSVYVTANTAWYEGSAKSSIKVTTDSSISFVHPFVFELPTQYVDLSSASTDKITVNMVTDAVLTDTKIAAFLCYPDGTTSVQSNWITSGATVGTGNYGTDPLSAGTTLSTSALGAADWTGEPASPNFYKMDLDTSGDAGQATAVSIRIEVYYDFTTDGDVLYIDPLLEVGT